MTTSAKGEEFHAVRHWDFCALARDCLFLALAGGYWIGKFQFGKFQMGGVAGLLLVAVLLNRVRP